MLIDHFFSAIAIAVAIYMWTMGQKTIGINGRTRLFQGGVNLGEDGLEFTVE